MNMASKDKNSAPVIGRPPTNKPLTSLACTATCQRSSIPPRRPVRVGYLPQTKASLDNTTHEMWLQQDGKWKKRRNMMPRPSSQPTRRLLLLLYATYMCTLPHYLPVCEALMFMPPPRTSAYRHRTTFLQPRGSSIECRCSPDDSGGDGEGGSPLPNSFSFAEVEREMSRRRQQQRQQRRSAAQQEATKFQEAERERKKRKASAEAAEIAAQAQQHLCGGRPGLVGNADQRAASQQAFLEEQMASNCPLSPQTRMDAIIHDTLLPTVLYQFDFRVDSNYIVAQRAGPSCIVVRIIVKQTMFYI